MIEEFYKSELIKILSEMGQIPTERAPLKDGDDGIKQIYTEVKALEKIAYLRGKKDGLKIFKDFINE